MDDDPRDEEYRAHSGGAAVGLVLIILFVMACAMGAFK